MVLKRTNSAFAFTLVELLVVITVISVILALATPALRGSRVASQTILCQANIRGISQLISLGTADRKGVYPNGLQTGTEYAVFRLHNITTSVYGTKGQTDSLHVPLGVCRLISNESDIVPLSCPVELAILRSERGSRDPKGDELFRSYKYSIAFFTDPLLWRSDVPANREKIDAFRRDVRVEDVLFPSAKVLLSEQQDFHGEGTPLGSPFATARQRCNSVFADGHTARIEPMRAAQSLPIRWELFSGDNSPRSMPFSAPPDGCRGRDY